MSGNLNVNVNVSRARQQVTPELRKWIVEQAQAGHGAESVLKAMLGDSVERPPAGGDRPGELMSDI